MENCCSRKRLCFFCNKKTTLSEDNRVTYFQCNRSGKYVSNLSNPNERQRELQIQGSRKINAYCPARMKSTLYIDGSCKLHTVKLTFGHMNQTQPTSRYQSMSGKGLLLKLLPNCLLMSFLRIYSFLFKAINFEAQTYVK